MSDLDDGNGRRSLKNQVQHHAHNALLAVVARWASIAIVPLAIAMGQRLVSWMDRMEAQQQQTSAALTNSLADLRVNLTHLDDGMQGLSRRVDDVVTSTAARLDQQSRWIQKQSEDLDHLKEQVYRLPPVRHEAPADAAVPAEEKARQKWQKP